MREFLAEYKYQPSIDLREVASESSDEEIGDIGMTLIRAKIRRVRDKL